MKIIKLDITDIGGIKAFEVEPNGNHVVIGGPNAAGKSTVLNAIAGALGGHKNRKAQSVRKGSKKGTVVADLGDLIVKWMAKEGGRDALVVETKDGAVLKSPQKRLEKLFGDRTVDPLAFFIAAPKDQARMLADVAGVDLEAMENERKQVFAKRTLENRILKERESEVKSFGNVERDLPDDQIDTDAIVSELSEVKATIEKNRAMREKLEGLEQEMERREKVVDFANQNKTKTVKEATDQADRDIAEAEMALEEAQKRLERMRSRRHDFIILAEKQADVTIEEAETKLNEVKARVEKGRFAVCGLVDPNPDEIQEKLTEAQKTNHLINRLSEFRSAESKAAGQRQVCKTLTEKIATIDKRKAEAIDSAPIPVDGLGLEDGMVTFNGLPLENLSGAECLRVSVALAIASSPDIRIMLIDRWGDLDDDSRKVVMSMADEHDFQIWTTIVGVKDEDITVKIIDGTIDSAEPKQGELL